MTQQELDAIFNRSGLKVPEKERRDMVEAAHFIEAMKLLIRKKRSVSAEPAHVVSFTNNDRVKS